MDGCYIISFSSILGSCEVLSGQVAVSALLVPSLLWAYRCYGQHFCITTILLSCYKYPLQIVRNRPGSNQVGVSSYQVPWLDSSLLWAYRPYGQYFCITTILLVVIDAKICDKYYLQIVRSRRRKTCFHLYQGQKNSKLRLARIVCVGGGQTCK